MRIKSEQLYKFVKKATISGSIGQALFKVENGVIGACNKTTDNVALVSSTMPTTSTDKLVLPIKNTSKFLQIINLFEGDVELVVNEKGNMLSLFNKNRQVDFTLAEESFIENAIPGIPERIQYANQAFTVPSNVFKNTVKNSSVFKDKAITINLDGANLNLTTGEKGFDKIKESIPLPSTIQTTATYGTTLSDIIDNLGAIVKFNIAADYPVYIEETDDNVKSVYIVAPMVKNE